MQRSRTSMLCDTSHRAACQSSCVTVSRSSRCSSMASSPATRMVSSRLCESMPLGLCPRNAISRSWSTASYVSGGYRSTCSGYGSLPSSGLVISLRAPARYSAFSVMADGWYSFSRSTSNVNVPDGMCGLSDGAARSFVSHHRNRCGSPAPSLSVKVPDLAGCTPVIMFRA